MSPARTSATTRTIETFDPRTGSLLAVVPEMDAEDVRSQIARARAVAPSWGSTDLAERTRHLLEVRQRILDRAEELAGIICAETGKQPAEAVTTELMAVCETIDWYARHARRLLEPRTVASLTLAHKRGLVRYEPLGVVGVISPWNYPFTLSMTPLVTALFAGNTVVLKPSEVTPTVGLAIGELFAHDIWGDVVRVVTGGGQTGDALVRGDVDKIAFTGSVATGRAVMAAASENLTPVLLELGGKDPMIVCADADIERAAKGAVWGAFQNSGQTCMSVERVYVEAAVAEEFIDRVIVETSRIRQDAGGGDIGSMTRDEQVDIVETHLTDARDKGATIVTGGNRLERDGVWFEPTVLTGVDHSMAIMTEETFGPVLPIMAVPDVDTALRHANSTEYGLNSSVWTADEKRGMRIAEELRAGNVCINDCIVSYAITAMPFGGVENSGFGRVHGPEGLHEFCATKSIMSSRFTPAREIWWFPVPKKLDSVGISALRLRFGRSPLRRLLDRLG